MASFQVTKCLRTKSCLISRARSSNSLRCNDLLKAVSSLRGTQGYQRMYSSSSKGPSESDEDTRNKPIPFSTSRARNMTLNQTLGYGVEIDQNPSKKSIYVGMFLMAVMTYIILFLPADEDELDLLELEIEKEGGE